MTDKRPFPLPTGYFAIPLGLSALSLAWLHMGDTISFSRNVSDIIGITSVSVWALFVLLYIYKMIYFSHEVRDELLLSDTFFVYCLNTDYNDVKR